jgi:hypothetical protein
MQVPEDPFFCPRFFCLAFVKRAIGLCPRMAWQYHGYAVEANRRSNASPSSVVLPRHPWAHLFVVRSENAVPAEANRLDNRRSNAPLPLPSLSSPEYDQGMVPFKKTSDYPPSYYRANAVITWIQIGWILPGAVYVAVRMPKYWLLAIGLVALAALCHFAARWNIRHAVSLERQNSHASPPDAP